MSPARVEGSSSYLVIDNSHLMCLAVRIVRYRSSVNSNEHSVFDQYCDFSLCSEALRLREGVDLRNIGI